MFRSFVLRFVQAASTLILASMVVFALVRTTGNPVDTLLPVDATREQREAFIEEQGLDEPLPVQYGYYVLGMLSGDFGTSLRTGRPVTELVFDRAGNSLLLASAAMAFALMISVPLGVTAAVYRGRFADKLALVVSVLGQSVPPFWTGILAILLFAVVLGWLPTSGMGSWQHFILPAVAMGWPVSAGIVRLLRSSMLEVLDAEFIKLARIKGASEAAIVWRHALPNAAIPVLTYIGFMYGIILAAAITTEVVFNWPGLGRLAYEAVLWRDFPLLQFAVLTWAALIIVINLMVDTAYVVLDPRIRL